nr:anther-specific proline-rich protein APG-like [Penaeus vannamei]
MPQAPPSAPPLSPIPPRAHSCLWCADMPQCRPKHPQATISRHTYARLAQDKQLQARGPNSKSFRRLPQEPQKVPQDPLKLPNPPQKVPKTRPRKSPKTPPAPESTPRPSTRKYPRKTPESPQKRTPPKILKPRSENTPRTPKKYPKTPRKSPKTPPQKLLACSPSPLASPPP